MQRSNAALRNVRYLRAPAPIRFPEQEIVPESKRHLLLRTLLYQMLKLRFAGEACLGSDQFVYWNADDPRRCLAPDVFVRMGVADELFGSWKTWERGAPDLAVEMVSDSDAPAVAWSEKLARYRELGVAELVRFDADAPPAERLRIWDRVEGDLVERVVEDDSTFSPVLGACWVVAPADEIVLALRVADDTPGGFLWPTLTEAREAEAKAREAEARAREVEAKAREVEAKARAAEAKAREAAERRVAELEAELARRPAR